MSIISDLFDLIYPDLCVVCGEPLVGSEKEACISCLNALQHTPFSVEDYNATEKLLWGRYEIARGASFCRYVKGGVSQKLLHSVKYHGNRRLALELGRFMGREMAKVGNMNADCLIPVPLHESKLKKRGYNQSRILADGVSEICGLPVVDDVLFRSVANPTQTKQGAFERWENTKGIFDVHPCAAKKLKDRHLLLIDDVVTTGSTIEACCHALSKIEGVKISFYCFASA